MENIYSNIEPQQMWEYIRMKGAIDSEDMGIVINYGDCGLLTYAQLLSILHTGNPEKMGMSDEGNYPNNKYGSTNFKVVYSRFMKNVVSRCMELAIGDSVKLTSAGNVAMASNILLNTLVGVWSSLVYINWEDDNHKMTLEMYKDEFYQEFTQRVADKRDGRVVKDIIIRVDEAMRVIEENGYKRVK